MLRPLFLDLVMSTDILSFEHPSVLLFCLILFRYFYSCICYLSALKRTVNGGIFISLIAPWKIKLNSTPVVGESLTIQCIIPRTYHVIEAMEWRRIDTELEAYVVLEGCVASKLLERHRYTVECRRENDNMVVRLLIKGQDVTSSLNGSRWRCVEFNTNTGSRILQIHTIG